jgi:hypothetical protein
VTWKPLVPCLNEAYAEAWTNGSYGVGVDRRDDRTVAHLVITPAARERGHNWTDFQRIKDQLAGEDAE